MRISRPADYQDARARVLPGASEIDWIEPQGNYANGHGGSRQYLFREAIGTLEGKLDPRKFRRIHRSTIVNIGSIRELRASFHGDYDVLLRDGPELKLGHRYRDNLEKTSQAHFNV